MKNDAPSTSGATLPPRAAIAMLTLQLRAAQQEAVAAEADDASREQLRTRLESLMDERRRALDTEVQQARAEAAATVAAARRAASVMAARAAPAAPAVNGFTPPVEPVAFAAPLESPAQRAAKLVPPTIVTLRADDDITAPVPITVADVPPPAPAPPLFPPRPTGAPIPPAAPEPAPFAPAVSTALEPLRQSGAAASSNLVIDAEAFAAVFATVVAKLLDERSTGARSAPAPAVVAAPAKQGFWTYARHPDVILLGLTTAIVLVVLAAWLA